MYYRIIKDDVLKSKGVTLATLLFIVAAAALVASGAALAAQLFGAVDALMEAARTPHFMQMHAGELDRASLERFASLNELVEDYSAGEFLNISGARFSLGSKTLADSVQDNGLWTQKAGMDLLLSLDGEMIRPVDGELYVPLAYLKDGTAALGDEASVAGRRFRVAGFLRDSQMNSPLASSKRFLVSEGDFEALRADGSVEYLISFRLKDPAALGAFEAAYAESGLPANGPTLSYPLFRLINAVSDGLLAALLTLSGALTVCISLLCVRFTLLAKIEEDYREIGVMKAIGLRLATIKRIYLAKYAAMAALGGAAGWGLSLAFRRPLLAGLKQSMGEGAGAGLGPALSALGASLVALSIVCYVSLALGRFRRLSAAEALRFGAPADARAGANRPRLSRSRVLGVNTLLGIKDVWARKRLYAVMAIVMAAATFMAVVPTSLYSTMASPGFSAYMGVGECDLRLGVQQAEDIPARAAAIAEALRADPAVLSSVALTTKALWTTDPSGARIRLKVELGDHRSFPVLYSDGVPPTGPGEIALSAMNAADLRKATGDAMVIYDGSSYRKLRVSGVYGDLTNGGKTAKASFEAPEAEAMWAAAYAKLRDPSRAAEAAERYATAFPYAKASDIGEFVRQTFSATLDSVKTAAYASVAVALAVAALISYLFMRMLIAKDRRPVAIVKALGFSEADLSAQFAVRSILVLAVGVSVGVLAADTLGESLAGAAITSFGAAAFRFTGDPLVTYLAIPAGLVLSSALASYVGARGAGRAAFVDHLKE
ncbi:MAG: ABC transporter permease [Spirochaetae bacterium HGW-Spirochaetae-3]|jgi:putative ABC transport system permease protein|nr:MAG: ABC transporter permease [Spirochaetae bacterium HGW-Spirochaetae-3]